MQEDAKRGVRDESQQDSPAATSGFDAAEYIRQNYDAADRLAIIVRNRVTGETIQRLASAEKIASAEFQGWLRHKNARGADVYISQNSLRPGARTRTKGDIEKVRHVYVDLDRDGDAALQRVRHSEHVPAPNYTINTSPHKYQIIWKVEGIAPSQAESLQKALVEQFDGDPAATDCTRALRLPGFDNKKYSQDYPVTAHPQTTRTYSLADFRLPTDDREHYGRASEQSENRTVHTGQITQSERDWAYAKSHLANDESPEALIRVIAHFRQDKANPDYYSRQTVTRAYASVALSRGDKPADVQDRIAALATHQPNPISYAKATITEMRARNAPRELDLDLSAPKP
jgi:hypothetical protein